jgi:hypothetical protein
MNTIPEDDPRKRVPPQKLLLSDDELEGLMEMGMKHEALKEARRRLKQSETSAQAFSSAVDAILVQADKLKTWTKLVDFPNANGRPPASRLCRTAGRLRIMRVSCV